MSRVVTVRLDRFSAVVSGDARLWVELRRSGLRWHRHETQRASWRVHRADADDLITLLEIEGYDVVLLGRPSDSTRQERIA